MGAKGGGQRRRGDAGLGGARPRSRGGSPPPRELLVSATRARASPPACPGRGDSSRFGRFPSRVLGLAGLIPVVCGFPPHPGPQPSPAAAAVPPGWTGLAARRAPGAAAVCEVGGWRGEGGRAAAGCGAQHPRWAGGLPGRVSHRAEPLGVLVVRGEQVGT